MSYTATYSPDDNKLRLYASSRLPRDLYDRVKAAGFRWAPKQDLFVAPMWTPAREDLLIELAGEVGDEDTSLVDRAEQRAERFEDYSEKRAQDSERAHATVQQICDGIPLGQPILVGHHSERHARRDAKRIDTGMRKAVTMWKRAEYWEARAAGCLHHAKYKELPRVRANRIKTIEADKRKAERDRTRRAALLDLWMNWEKVQRKDMPEPNDEMAERNVKCGHGAGTSDLFRALWIAEREEYTSAAFPLAKFPREPNANRSNMYEGNISYHSALELEIVTPEWCRNARIATHTAYIAHYDRWIEHYDLRLGYERAMLAEQGATSLLDKKPKSAKALCPLLNYRAEGGSITTENQYNRGEAITYPQVDMTKAEYAAINGDYKGTRWSADKSHRFRSAMIRHSLVCVFLTDLKAVDQPKPTKEVFLIDRHAKQQAAE